MDIVPQARALLAALVAKLQLKGITVKAILRKLQRFVEADKAVVIGVLMNAIVALAAALKFHVSGYGVAVVSTVVNLGVQYFLAQNYKAKLAAAKLPKE